MRGIVDDGGRISKIQFSHLPCILQEETHADDIPESGHSRVADSKISQSGVSALA